MHKVGFFRSIQSKFTVIYILLLLVAVQVIGAYFASQLETELTTNFKSSVNDRIELLSYNLEQAFKKDRSNDEPTLQQEIQTIVSDIDTKDIMTLEVVNNQRRVLGSNDTVNNSEIIGKKSTREIVQKAIYGSKPEDTLYDPKTESRVFVKAVPIYGEDNQVVGAIYIESSMEGVYSQLQNINEIFF